MRYDVSFKINAGAGPIEIGKSFNHTWDCNPMFRKALTDDEGLYSLTKQSRSLGVCNLNRAIQRMEDNKAAYMELNPANGWGDYESALKFLKSIRDEWAKMPFASIHIS